MQNQLVINLHLPIGFDESPLGEREPFNSTWEAKELKGEI